MIIDKVENLKFYERLLPELAKIAELLDSEDFAAKQPGRYDVDGDKLIYDIYFRGAGEKKWKLLEDDYQKTLYRWETGAVPDGIYFIKV